MKKTLVIFGTLAIPGLAFAQGTGDLASFVFVVGNIVNLLVPMVSTLAVVYFFYGLAKYILNSGDEDKRKEGKDIMIWGILAMFVIVTIWGIIGFIQATVGNTGGAWNNNAANGTILTPNVTPSGIVGGTTF